MAITGYTQQQVGNATIVTVTSDLEGTIYYHWYLDGSWIASTESPTRAFVLEVGEQVRIEVHDTTDPDYDPIGNAPAAYPPRRTVDWLRSLSSDVVAYRVEQQKDAGSWDTISSIARDGATWEYALLTPRLDDLSTYDWRVYPIDVAGNDGTVLNLDSEKIVRTPDSPNYTITFDEGTAKVTFAAA